MEFFERAHVVKNKWSKNSKITENKKKRIKQMLFGYKVNDNTLIQKSTELENDYEDSTSVSGYSDLNLTNSSNEDENSGLNLEKDSSDVLDSEETVLDESFEKKFSDNSIQSSGSYKSNDCSASQQFHSSFDSENKDDNPCFSEESISEGSTNMDSLESYEFGATESVEEADPEYFTDSETSIVMRGLNLSDSDISDFDADGQLAAKIQERLQKIKQKNKNNLMLDNCFVSNTKEQCNIEEEKTLPMSPADTRQMKKNRQKHRDKYTILQHSDNEAKGPITKERCSLIQEKNEIEAYRDELNKVKCDKQKHKDKYTIVLDKKGHKKKYNIPIDDVTPVGALNIETLSIQAENAMHPMSEDDSSISDDELNEEMGVCELKSDYKVNDETIDDELNNEEDSVMTPPYVSITAVDMLNQSLDDILGEYKYPTIKNIPSDNNVLSTNNSVFYVEENIEADISIEDDVDSLIPELDECPKLEEIDEEIINLDRTTGSLDKTVNTESELSGNDTSLEYDNIAETFKVYYGTQCCVITMKYPSELFIQGKVKITCLGGTVELFGYTLDKEASNIYAPYYNFAQCIKTVENQNVYYGLFGKLTTEGLSVSEAENIVTSIGEYDGVVLLQRLKCKGMEFVENNFRVTNLFKCNKPIEPYFSKACDLLDCSLFSSRPYKSFLEHPSWPEAHVLAVSKHSRGLVCGGKGAGKSTYVRYQVNKLLAHGPVLVVDLDPGQSLFTVAGSVSVTVVTAPLLGPSFTHLRKPELMLNMGMINTMDNAKLYASAVQTLITHCQNNSAFADMPWIVNTMGMTNSLGLKFMTLIITLLNPTYVLQYESKLPNLRFETLLTASNVKDLYEEYHSQRGGLLKNVICSEDLDYSFVVAHDVDSPHASKGTFKLRPRDERYLNFLAYFSQLLTTGESLLGITPYEVSLKDLRIATNVPVKREHAAKVLNGKLVALCQLGAAEAARRDNVFTLADKPLPCRGHGLIRGVDWEKELLYVTTPVPGSELAGVDTLLYADWAPDVIVCEGVPAGTALPYCTRARDKHLMSTPRRRFTNPLQLLNVARGLPN